MKLLNRHMIMVWTTSRLHGDQQRMDLLVSKKVWNQWLDLGGQCWVEAGIIRRFYYDYLKNRL